MKYQQTYDAILKMNCQKIYKPVLILAYIDYINLTRSDLYVQDHKVELKKLIPFISYYLKQDQVIGGSKSIQDLSSKNIYATFVSGPLYRIEAECNLFRGLDVDGIKYFGLTTTNESINWEMLFNIIKSACVKLLLKNDITITQLNYEYYSDILQEIETTKVDQASNPPKIYKYLLILSLLDYFKDMNCEERTFNQPIPVTLLVEYYQLNLSDDWFGEFIQNKKLIEGTKNNLIHHIRESPLRRLCKSNGNFLNDDKNFNSRKDQNLPTTFAIALDFKADPNIAITLIRDKCHKMIEHRTGRVFDTDIIDALQQSFKNGDNNNVRKGQGIYRRHLLEKYQNKCVLCGIDFSPILVASHAKPWVKCVNVHERLTDNNGLLLCSNHDDLFDKGFISFDIYDNYQILISSEVTSTVRHDLETSIDNQVKKYAVQSTKMQKYLKYHYNHIFKA